jgi:hypothetical protein
MNGDPFATIVERGKLALDGLCRYWEGVWAEENKPVAAVRIEPQVHVKANDDCPSCHGPKTIREISHNTFRCMNCGWQPRVINAPGISRNKFESFSYPSREHQQFMDAMLQIIGPRR